MSSSIKEKLAQYYLHFRKDANLRVFNKAMSKKVEKELLDFILNEQLNNQDDYFSYKLEGNKIVSLVFSRKMNDYGEHTLPTEMVIQDSCITKSMIEEEIIKIKLFYKNNYKYTKIVFPARSTQNKLIQLYNELSFSFTGNTYLGQVRDALKYYSNKNLLYPEGIILRAGIKNDLTEILELAKICHSADKTSRMNNDISSFLKVISKFYKNSIKDKSLFLITNKTGIIGYIMIVLNKDSNTLIGDIGVHPNYWGNGFANILYNFVFLILLQLDYN